MRYHVRPDGRIVLPMHGGQRMIRVREDPFAEEARRSVTTSPPHAPTLAALPRPLSATGPARAGVGRGT